MVSLVRFANFGVSYVAEGAALTRQLTLSAPSSSEVRATVRASSYAASDMDVTDKVVVFAPGQTTASFSINTYQDSLYEGDEVFSLTLVSVAGAEIDRSTDSSVYGYIVDDDRPTLPTVRFADRATSYVAEGASLTRQLTLSAPSSSEVRATVRASSYAASDMDVTDKVVVFAPGQTTASFSINTYQDNLYEGDEVFSLTLVSVTGAEIDRSIDASVYGYIVDDDRPTLPTVRFVDRATSYVAEGASLTRQLTLSAPSSSEVRATVRASSYAASDMDVTDKVVVFAPGQTTASFSINTYQDNLYEGDEVFSLTLVSVTGAEIDRSIDASVYGYIVDDDRPDSTPPSLTITAPTGPLNNRSPTISGTIGVEDVGRAITILEGTSVVGSATVSPTGRWTSYVVLFGDGPHNLVARATDAAGNTGTSAPVTFVVDTVAPTLTITTADGYVRSGAQTVSGTISLADAGRTVTVYDGGDAIATAVAGLNGRWSAAVTLVGEGSHALFAQATDLAGNTGSAPRFAVLTLDTTPPAVTIADATGSVYTTRHVITGTVGTRDAGRLVTLVDRPLDGSAPFASASTVVKVDGSWSLEVLLPYGQTHALSASVTDLAGNTGVSSTITLTSVDPRPSFGTVTHDAASHGGQVFSLYDAILGRDPDALGLEHWAGRMDEGASARGLAQIFLTSAEGTAIFGGRSNPDFVTKLYEVALDRAPDAGGLAGWTRALETGTSRADVAYQFASSGEHLNIIHPDLNAGIFVPDETASGIARLYHTVLGRTPDAAGFQHWTHQADAGTSLADVASAFVQSPEGRASTGSLTSGAFVEYLYEHALGRHSDAAGLAGWTSLIESQAVSRSGVALAFADSPEAHLHLAPQVELGWHLV